MDRQRGPGTGDEDRAGGGEGHTLRNGPEAHPGRRVATPHTAEGDEGRPLVDGGLDDDRDDLPWPLEWNEAELFRERCEPFRGIGPDVEEDPAADPAAGHESARRVDRGGGEVGRDQDTGEEGAVRPPSDDEDVGPPSPENRLRDGAKQAVDRPPAPPGSDHQQVRPLLPRRLDEGVRHRPTVPFDDPGRGVHSPFQEAGRLGLERTGTVTPVRHEDEDDVGSSRESGTGVGGPGTLLREVGGDQHAVPGHDMRHSSSGTVITNRAPFSVPSSPMVIPVIPRISRAR